MDSDLWFLIFILISVIRDESLENKPQNYTTAYYPHKDF